jgi:hypothetical protein
VGFVRSDQQGYIQNSEGQNTGQNEIPIRKKVYVALLYRPSNFVISGSGWSVLVTRALNNWTAEPSLVTGLCSPQDRCAARDQVSGQVRQNGIHTSFDHYIINSSENNSWGQTSYFFDFLVFEISVIFAI